MNLDELMRHLTERQHGAVARWQLPATWEQLRSRARGPDWEFATPHVLRLVGAPSTPEATAMTVVLDGGREAVASHAMAAALWRLPGFRFGEPEVSRPRGRSSRRLARGRLHEPRSLPPHHLTLVHGVPVTSVGRTIFDVAPRLHPNRLERLVDSVTARSPAVLRTLHSLLDEFADTGRAGCAAMRSVLAERPDGYIPPATGLERRFCDILRDAGEPPLDRQVDLGGHGWIGRVDFVDRALGLVVEIDSALHHTSRLDQLHDEARDEALLAVGWRRVLRIEDHLVWGDPAHVVRQVRCARAELRAA